QVKLKENTPAKIFSDRQRLMQILKNFIANAIKYTEQGNVAIEISKSGLAGKISGNGGFSQDKAICFSVKDTGIGISKDKQRLIFEAFKQADGTISRKYGGTGLGLSISKNLAHLLGGEIQLESEEGKGSNFMLYIPEHFESEKSDRNKIIASKDQQITSEDKDIDESPTIETEEGVGETSTKNAEFSVRPADLVPAEDNIRDDRKHINKGDKIILIIEDDQNFAQILYDLAHERDFKCLLAKNGETGLHYADFYKPQAIILDIGLPGINGWEVMERLKENPETRHIPVHFMSAAEKNLEAMKMGAIGYLSKPASVESIQNAFSKIETTLSKSVRNLLIVEDDKVMRKSIVELIDGENIKIKGVETGKEGVECLMTGDYDCMILDLGLKDISGFDLLEKIRKDSRIPRIPIIIYTGRELSREENMRLQKYADSIIIKGAHSPERLLSEATLFLHQVESKLPKSKQKILKMMHRKEAALSGKKVLIVDDDMRNVFALTSVLEEASIKVVVGRNGKEGLEQLEKNEDINLVLMDIMMPEMDGYEAMQQIRGQQKHKKLPVIALTAKAMKDDRDKCIQAGANDYLTKPVDTDKLLSLLRVWMYN
ncbi:MAG: response regulator, partial [Bacteroidetes bacterium]|nr:response regulator [Bacteroidota bacterium]